MADALRWRGDVASFAALARRRAQGAPRLVLDLDATTGRDTRTGVPDFVLEEQLACLGLAPAEADPARGANEPPPIADLAATARALGVRAFVCATRPPASPELLGRFLDDDMPSPLASDTCGTLVVGGPMFHRRFSVVAGEIVETQGRFTIDVGLRGC